MNISPKKLASGSVGVEEKQLEPRKKAAKVEEVVVEGNPFEGFDPASIVLLVPIEGGHKDRTLELLQALSEKNEFEVPYIAHQVRLDRIGPRVIFPVVAYALGTGPKGNGQRKDWRLHIGTAVDCSKVLPALSFDSESETAPNFDSLVKQIQKSLKRKVKNAGPSYLVRMGKDTVLTLQSC